ncbi:MAG: TldD/PmbA family protein [Nitrospirae bacterium]|nr:TldD/PmbA family protein [Nitrospirota bacterium]
MIHTETHDIATLAPFLKDLVRHMERRVPYAAVLVTDEAGERVRTATTEEQVGEAPPSRGAVVTVHTGRATVEAAVDVLTEEALAEAAEQAMARAAQAGLLDGGVAPDPGPVMDHDFATPEETPYAAVPLADKVARARALRDQAHAADGRVVNAFGMISHTRSRELFVNRNKRLFQDLRRTQAVVGVTVSVDGAAAALMDGRGRRGGWEAAALPDGLVPRLVADCARIAGAPRLKAGYYDCIFSPEFSGIFAHEAFGHGTEADMFVKKRSKGEEYLGKPVAAPQVTLFDDPDLPDAAASYFFDHEGQLASRTQIIEKGVLVRPITDMHTAHALGLPRTANGRRESFARKAYTRMSNTFFGPGHHDFGDMLADIEYGFYLERPSNGMEDPKSWGIQLEGHMASEIMNGKLTGRIFSPVIVTGYVPELLTSITMVGREVEITGLGMCGKGYKEWVKVTDGGPCLRLKARLA